MAARILELEAELELQKQLKEEREEEAMKRKRELALMEYQLSRLIPEVNELNTLAEEMRQRTVFELKLFELKDVQLRVTNLLTKAVWTWSPDKFDLRLHIARDLYNRWTEEGPFAIPRDENPFWDPPEDTQIGRAHLFLEPLSYLFDIAETLPIVDHRGKKDGSIRVEVRARAEHL
eukprot:tig00000443_g781.t1